LNVTIHQEISVTRWSSSYIGKICAKISGKFCIFPDAHFERKNGKISGKIQKKIPWFFPVYRFLNHLHVFKKSGNRIGNFQNYFHGGLSHFFNNKDHYDNHIGLKGSLYIHGRLLLDIWEPLGVLLCLYTSVHSNILCIYYI